MSKFKDRLGRKIEIGDTVVYATPTQDKYLKIGVVEDIVVKIIETWERNPTAPYLQTRVQTPVPHFKIVRPKTVWDSKTGEYVEQGTTAMYTDCTDSERFIVITELVKK